MSGLKNIEEPNPEFDWITLREDMDKLSPTETTKEKMARKISENPFVPFGCLATVAALSLGLRSFYMGNSVVSQKMMRFRIAAQGFTVFAIIGGIYTANVRGNTNFGIFSAEKKDE